MRAQLLRDLRGAAVATVLLTAIFGLGYPALMTGFGQGAVLASGERQPHHGEREGRRLGARRAGVHEPEVLHGAPLGDEPDPVQRGRDDVLEPRPDRPGADQGGAGPGRGDPQARRALQPRADSHDIPVDAVVASGSGIDPEISIAYADLQARRVAAVRHLPLATVQPLIGQVHGRALLGLLRRAGRERARAQPRTRRARKG